jgi:hypothetical protein
MVTLQDIAKKIKGSNGCEQLVKYNGQEVTLSGASLGMGTFKINIGSFANKIKEINAVPPVMMAMDNNQFLLCQQAHQLDDNPQLKDMCIRIRLMHLMAFTQLQALLSVPPSEEMGKQILEWTKQMNTLTAQSIEMLRPPSTKSWALDNKADMRKKSISRSPSHRGEPKIKMSKIATIEVAPTIKKVMAYQGIDETQMQDALKTLKE